MAHCVKEVGGGGGGGGGARGEAETGGVAVRRVAGWL